MKHALGCHPCPPDAKGNAELHEILGMSLDELTVPPATLDLGRLVFNMRNQGPFGLCVGFGVTQAAANCARQQPGMENMADLSPLGTYVQACAIDGALHQVQDGTTVDAALRGCGVGGFLFEAEYPYRPDERDANDVPARQRGFPLHIGQTGLRRCGMRTHRIQISDLDAFTFTVKQLLANGKGVVGGWQVDQAFELWTPDQGPWDGLVGPSEGGHCVCVQDYPTGDPRITNSWSENAGDHGFWTFTWRALHKATSLWAVDFVPLAS